MRTYTVKQRIGCWLNERRQTEAILRSATSVSSQVQSWLDLKNRNELISTDPVSGGRICHWQDSSPLTVSRVFPRVGARILQACLRQWPVSLSDVSVPRLNDQPQVSFIVGVRGLRRVEQFQAVIRSLSNQTGATVEIVVVEQSSHKEFESLVPRHVRYHHTPLPHPQTPFNRSWALNAGAVVSRGRVLILHDADMVVPQHFAAAAASVVRDGIDALRLPRLIFYLDQPSSISVQRTGGFSDVYMVDRIVQNNPTPMAITRDAYFGIGGHDESFYGWGGEDNEFLDRVRTLKICEGAFLPVFHLWHEEAPNRSGDRNSQHLRSLMQVSKSDRISILAARPFGRLSPSVAWKLPVSSV